MVDDTALPAFARRLKELRAAAKMTQKELAERTGMHLGGIFKLEQGVNRPSWDTVQLLARALGVSCEAFTDPELQKPEAREPPAKKTRKRKG
jgi:transcriptional regulator with XRE-family HTH domain